MARKSTSYLIAIVAAASALWGDADARAQTYAPAVAGNVCEPTSAAPVSYVAETSYQTVMRPITVTAYRAVTSVDPLTGYLVTYMAPTTTTQWQAQRIAHTSYRPVYQATLGSGNGSQYTATAPLATYAMKPNEIITDLQSDVSDLTRKLELLESKRNIDEDSIRDLMIEIASLRRELSRLKEPSP